MANMRHTFIESIDKVNDVVNAELIKLTTMSLRTEKIGRLVGLIALLIPSFTWVFAYNHALDKVKLENFWIITLSSTTVSFVCTTICIIMLKHSKIYTKRIEDLQKQLDHIIRIKALALTNFSASDRFNLDIVLANKLAETYGFISADTEDQISTDETNGIHSFFIDALKKTPGR